MKIIPPFRSADFWILVCALLTCSYVLSQRYVDPDMWGHIQYGADWIAAGQMPRTASHTYADPDYVWVNHENLAELSMALIHRYFGGLGLMIVKTILGGLMLLAIRTHAVRRGVGNMWASLILLPVAYGLASAWLVRPQLASMLCFTAQLFLLDWAAQDRDDTQPLGWPIWLTIPLIAIWTNAHGGFLAGICVLIAWTGARWLLAVVKHGFANNKRSLLQVVGLSLAAIAAPLVNPYGVDLPYWLFHSLGTPRPEIAEWVSVIDDPVYLYAWCTTAVIAAFAWACSALPKRWADVIVFTLVTMQGFAHVRHIPFMALMVGIWIPLHLQSACTRWSKPNVEAKPTSRGEYAFLISLAAVLLGIVLFQHAKFGVDREEYPIAATQFVADNDLNGRIVATFDWAQFTLAALPDSLVGFDGRFRTCYSQEVVDAHFDFISGRRTDHRHRDEAGSGPYDPTKILRMGEPHLAIIKQTELAAKRVMQQQEDWALLYADSTAQVWGTKNRYDDPNSKDFLPPAQRVLPAEFISEKSVAEVEPNETGITRWPALPTSGGLVINPVFRVPN